MKYFIVICSFISEEKSCESGLQASAGLHKFCQKRDEVQLYIKYSKSQNTEAELKCKQKLDN